MIDRRTLIKAAGSALVMSAVHAPTANADTSDPLSYASVDELVGMFKARKASPVDLLEAQIKRIEALNAKVNCITDEHFGEARKAARESEDRYRRGDARPLEGITVAIKDEFARPGWRVTQGSLVYKNSPPATENSAIIDFLDAAGAVTPIQTTVPEFYLFIGASTRAWGTTHNPWNLEYSPGGSSAGSGAALAAGFATLALGSDMGGSIRLPASQNGVYGFRPPFGRVGSGEVPYSTSGPMARRFDDLVQLQNAIVGPTDKIMAAIRPRLDYPLQYPDLSGWRIAVDWGAAIAAVVPSVRAAMEKGIETLRGAGCVVDEVDCGFSKEQKFIFMRGLFATSIGTLIETSRAHRKELSPYMSEVLDLVGPVGPAEAEAAETLIGQLHRQVQERVFGKGYRLLLMPTVSTPLIKADMFKSKAEKVDVWTGTGFGAALTWPWNLLNRYPIVDVPVGIAEDGMPTGMQAIGQTFSDLDAFQFSYNWSKLQPQLFADGRFPTFA